MKKLGKTVNITQAGLNIPLKNVTHKRATKDSNLLSGLLYFLSKGQQEEFLVTVVLIIVLLCSTEAGAMCSPWVAGEPVVAVVAGCLWLF